MIYGWMNYLVNLYQLNEYANIYIRCDFLDLIGKF
jgi:hypothetical protein